MFRKKVFSIFFALVLLYGMSLITAPPVAAISFTTIQAAINAASPGATIVVPAGTYDAAYGEVFPIIVNKSVTIISAAGAASTNISPTSADFSAFYVTAPKVTIGGNSSTGFNISAGGRGGIYANISGGNKITVQGNIFCSYSEGESRGMWFEALWNGSLVTGNSFAAPRVGTGIEVVNASGATISNNTAMGTGVKYCFLTFKAEAFYPDRDPGNPYAEYVNTGPSWINNVSVTGNTIDNMDSGRYGILFAASTKGSDHGEPEAQDLAVGGGVRITNNFFILSGGANGVGIDANKSAPDDATQIAHITGVENILINNNSFDSISECGVVNGQETAVNALYNWWGDVAGPSVSTNPYWYHTDGDSFYGNVDYIPWLIHKNLNSGWNIFSTPIALNTSTDTISKALNYWTSDSGKCLAAYYYNGKIWQRATSLMPMVPIYLDMNGSATIDVVMSTTYSTPPAITMYQGWNLVGPGQLYDMRVDDALASAYSGTSGWWFYGGTGLVGYSQVVSPSMNGNSWIYERDDHAHSWQEMCPTGGYWVYMVNQGTLGGFTYTPITEVLGGAP